MHGRTCIYLGGRSGGGVFTPRLIAIYHQDVYPLRQGAKQTLLRIRHSDHMMAIYAVLGGMSLGEIIGGAVALFVSVFAIFFWGSGLGWRESRNDRRNGL